MAETGKNNLRASIIIAAVLYGLDAFVFSCPFFAFGLFAVVLLYFLPATVWALRSDRRVARLRAAKAGIYLLAAVSIFLTIRSQYDMAARRAVRLGDACLAYRAKYHHYPNNLEALVPEFVPSVPVAMYGLLWGNWLQFSYSSNGDDREPMLYYGPIPPFGRHFYFMETRSWGVQDY